MNTTEDERNVMDRRSFLTRSAGAAAGMALSPVIGRHIARAAAAGRRPNILLFVADDAGWADVGFHGSKINTPNLDRLCRSGVELRHFYVDPVCSPTRASLMTGRPPSRFGIIYPLQIKDDYALPLDTVTIADMLSNAGYDTAITGKWHLGMDPMLGPNQFGFCHAYGYVGPWIDSYTHLTTDWQGNGEAVRQWHRNGELIDEWGHVTDLIAGEAVRFITDIRDDSKPFFLYVPFSAPHVPCQEERQWVEPYKNVFDNDSRCFYAAAMTHMDDAVGRIVRTVRDRGLAGDTLVIFFSDNGGQQGGQYQDTWLVPPYAYYMDYSVPDDLGHNEPLRGWKGQLYEGGIRVPAFVYWPGVLDAGSVDTPMSVRDLFPTLAAVTGAAVPADVVVEGADVWPAVTGSGPAPERVMYWRSTTWYAVRMGDWKLIHQGKSPGEGRDQLFNIARDPYEERDLAATESDILSRLKAELIKQAAMDVERV